MNFWVEINEASYENYIWLIKVDDFEHTSCTAIDQDVTHIKLPT